MTSLSFSRAVLMALALAVAGLVSCRSSSNPQVEADLIRATERQRRRTRRLRLEQPGTGNNHTIPLAAYLFILVALPVFGRASPRVS